MSSLHPKDGGCQQTEGKKNGFYEGEEPREEMPASTTVKAPHIVRENSMRLTRAIALTVTAKPWTSGMLALCASYFCSDHTSYLTLPRLFFFFLISPNNPFPFSLLLK